jgi:hypothetical protein
MTKFRQNTAMEDYLAFTVCVILLIAAAIGAFHGLRYLDTLRKAKEFAEKQAAIEAKYEKEQQQLAELNNYYEAQDQGFHHIPSIHYNE